MLVPDAYAHATALGGQLADGIDHAIKAAGLPWTAIRLGPRSGQWSGPMPRTGAQAYALTDDLLTRLIRIWLANRGIWDAPPGAGPTIPVPATPTDVTRYLEAYSGLLALLRLSPPPAGTTERRPYPVPIRRPAPGRRKHKPG